MQSTLWKDMIFRSEKMSEDCLYLNVWTPADHQASAALQGFLANFIKTGNPNGDGLPFWPWIQASIPKVMVIEAAPHLVNAPNGRRYEFLDRPLPH